MFYYRLINLTLIFLLMFLTACSNTNQLNINKITNEEITGEIIVWDEYSFINNNANLSRYKKRVEEMIEPFHKLYPNVTVLFDFFEQGKGRARFIDQVQRGAGANLLIASSDNKLLELIKMGALQDLDKYNINQSTLRPKALSQARYKNKLYGIPIYLSTQALCYNTKKVETPVKTLSDLIQEARKGYSVGIVSGFRKTFWGTGIFSKNKWYEPLTSDEVISSLEIHEKQFLNILQEGAWQTWMEWLKKAQTEPNFIVDKEDSLQQAFTQGRLAYLTCSSSWIPYAQEILGDETVGVTLLPHENNIATPILQTKMFIFNRASSQKQLEISLKLAQFLTNRQQQIELASEEVFIPSNQAISLNPNLYPIQATLIRQVQNSLGFNLDDVEQLSAIADVGEQLYTKVLAGELSSKKAASQLRQLLIEQ
ncbi:MAG: extracellular solute-binding protein [Microcystaceae cyanobacterium]